MKEPTEEQIKEFWGKIADKVEEYADGKHYHFKFGDEWYRGEQTSFASGIPVIDLNNLFKYAVPLLLKEHTLIETYSFRQQSGLYYSETCIWDRGMRGNLEMLKAKLISKEFVIDAELGKAEVLSEFWAIYKVIKGER